MTGIHDARRHARTFALVLAAWTGFYGMQAAMSAALSARTPGGQAPVIEMDLALALLWAVLSIGIAKWHQYARSIAHGLFALVALHVPALVLATLIDTVVSRIVWVHVMPPGPMTPFLAWMVFYADLDIVSYLAVVAVAETLLVRHRLLERQQLAKKLEASLSRARLDYLETQLQPHFLFNSLGAVSELAFDAPATAGRVLRQLTAIFRTALARKADEVTVGEEIVGVEPYLDIQRIRFADWLTIEYHVDDAAVDCLLPRFVLQPLIENAIRHGLSGRDAAGVIEIAATVDGNALLVRVTDNGVGLSSPAASTGGGIGLTNVRDRLTILYGDDDRLRLTSNSTGGAIAELRIPVRRRVHAVSDANDANSPTNDDHRVVSLPETDRRIVHVPALLRRPVVAIPVIWLCCGLLWTQQSFLYLTVRHRVAQTSWLEIARNDLTSAALWALLTPIIFALSKRLPLRKPHLAVRAIGYLLAGIVATVAHVAALQRLTMPDTPLVAPVWRVNIIVGFVIFLIVTAIGHRGLLVAWLEARERADAALTAELATAQARASKLQGIPHVLLHSLDGIAETVRRDPSLTERQLTRLGDYLRLALEATDARGVTPDRERALEDAVAALRDSGAYPTDLSLTA